MSRQPDPRDAAAALAEIHDRQGEVIDGVLVPAWYWWAVAIPMVGLGVVVDGGNGLAIGVTAAAFAAFAAVLTGWMIVSGVNGVKVSEELLGPRSAAEIVVFVLGVVAGAIGVASLAAAAHAPLPATIATTVAAAALVIAGPALMRRLRSA
ncbi:MAG TPA: hypothetical protein VK194_00185, partial [Candidatus Deferrimicrobium sp.]|nr:hypothetical protein [Candidatus Deferrimicrobium sp.]